MKCKKHPRYEARRRVRSGCWKCRLMYWLVGKGWIAKPVVRRAAAKTLRKRYAEAQVAGLVNPPIDHPPLPGIEMPADEAGQ